MLRRLRLKFILTNMLLVTVVLLAVFGALMISTAQQLERESAAAMKLALRQDGIPPQLELHLPDQGGAREWRWAIPVFCVTIEADGTLTLEEGSQVKVTEDTLAQAVQEIQEAQAPSGTLQNLGLRFQQEQLSDGRVRIAFSDLSWERASLGRLMVNSLLIGGAALAVFFAISLFLARLSLKPVERAWTQQRQFVADASHELKTPLTVILANTGIMAAHPDATVASQRKWLGYIQEEAQRMKELVEDMLFLAKHDGAERPKDSRTVNFSDLVTGCVLRFESVAFERQVELNSHIQPGLSLSGEPDSLERLVMILLDNAVKYAGEAGRVDVDLSRRQERAVLSVRNTGEPIPPEHLEHLFERFYRVDGSRSRKEGGYGLGLAIAHTIAQSHRGQIEVRSSREEGTVFTVTLPHGRTGGKFPVF